MVSCDFHSCFVFFLFFYTFLSFCLADIPEWDFSQQGTCNEMLLAPVCMFRDPFLLDPNKLILCEVLEETCR